MDEPLSVAINRRIRLLVGELARADEPDVRYPFVCQCGCLTQVALTLSEFDAGGPVYADGHAQRSGQSLRM